MKKCNRCKKEKPESEFGKNSQNPDGLRYECKTCNNHRRKIIRKQDPERARRKLLKRYNISYEKYIELYQKQNGKCRVCNKTEKSLGRLLSVDHDHKTGKVRGLLCFKCNTGIGLLKDNVKLLRKAIKYLQNGEGGED